MSTIHKILIAADASDASRQAVTYVGDIICGTSRTKFHIGLAHLVLPPRMSEWGGTENPAIEDEVAAERSGIYRKMEEDAIKNGRVLLQSLQRGLAEKGLDVTDLVVEFHEPLDSKEVARRILQAARDGGYGTVVVGRHSFSGLKRLFQHHVGEELVRAGEGIAIWVVE